jgi:hypothetical protein
VHSVIAERHSPRMAEFSRSGIVDINRTGSHRSGRQARSASGSLPPLNHVSDQPVEQLRVQVLAQ